MRAIAGGLLLAAGMLVALVGLGGALWTLASLYSSAIHDPLAGGDEQAQSVQRGMLLWAGVGAAGIVPMAIGSALLKWSLAARLGRAMRPRA